jgi:hypothetical protein
MNGLSEIKLVNKFKAVERSRARAFAMNKINNPQGSSGRLHELDSQGRFKPKKGN